MLTIADKPKNATGKESRLWDILIEADHDIIMAYKHVSAINLRIAEGIVNENGINPYLKSRLKEVCGRYRCKYGEIRP